MVVLEARRSIPNETVISIRKRQSSPSSQCLFSIKILTVASNTHPQLSTTPQASFIMKSSPVLLLSPCAIWAYFGARADGVLSRDVFLLSILYGALLMAAPIVMLKLSQRPYFKQSDTSRS